MAAREAERKALAFEHEAEEQEVSAAEVPATCMPPAAHDAAVATRNAAMKGAASTLLGWEG